MIKHNILWYLKDEYSEEEKAAIKKEMKESLTALVGKVPGLLELNIITDYLPSSNVDVMLDSTLESAEALKGYADHPDHVEVAQTKVRPFVKNRSCIDFEL